MNMIEILDALNEESKNLLDSTIMFTKYETTQNLSYLAKIHLVSANQALMSATVSNNPEMEIRVGIGHLRDVFNTYQIFIEKSINRGIIWFFGIRQDLLETTVTDYQLKLAFVASVISIIYKRIYDENNYVVWKSTALKYANPYIRNRKKAIQGWENAMLHTSQWGAPTKPDLKKREEYHKEIDFIHEFSQLINRI